VTEVSRRLQAARERAGLTIADLSASTKISAATLQAIERGDFSRLPGEFYIRAFLRSYARELRLPADDIVREYDAGRPAPAPPQATPEPRHPLRNQDKEASFPWTSPWAGATRTVAVVALAVVLLVAMVVRNRPAPVERSPEAGAVGTAGTVQAAPASPVTAARDAAPGKLRLEIQPTGPVWVTGAADGKRVLYRLLAPGERVTVEARDDLSFRIGNAAAFSYSINGVAGKSLGGPDEVREFQITRENYRTFRR
jgi:cytoskeletal protein RodZ